MRAGDAEVLGQVIQASAVNPQAVGIFNLKWTSGSTEVIGRLGADGAIVDNDYAKKRLLSVGSPLRLTAPNGKTVDLVIKGIFDPPTGGSPFGRVTISTSTWDKIYDQPENVFSFVRMKGGETDANKAALEKQLAGFPNAKVQTKQEFIDNQIGPLNAILNVLFVLLALSVIVSLFGIVNTLVLTVFERTRELGMLRAVGMTRRQIAADDPPRERDHCADGRRARDRARDRARRAPRRPREGDRLRAPDRAADHLRASRRSSSG